MWYHGLEDPSSRLPGKAKPHYLMPAATMQAIVKTEPKPGAQLREVPAQVREVEGDALTLAVAENVIRADLSPLEEARAPGVLQ